MKTHMLTCLGMAGALLLASSASAIDLGSSLTGATSGLDPATLASGSACNAAGIISFCVKNNYLGSDAVGTVKD